MPSTSPDLIEGAIGFGSEISSDVDWYSFDLESACDVRIQIIDPATGGNFAGTLSIFENAPNFFSDPDTAEGVRLLSQSTFTGESASSTVLALAAGTYYFAISGVENRDFHPYLANSGLPGEASTYQISIDSTPIESIAGTGSFPIASEPANNAILDSSPIVCRIRMNSALDPNSLQQDANVSIFRNNSGDFLEDPGQAVPISWINFNASSNELQFSPVSAFSPGYYRIILTGDSARGLPNISDIAGVPIGKDSQHPLGQDFTFDFQIDGIEGGLASNDSPATAIELGVLSSNQTIRSEGTIGDDPALNPEDPINPVSPGADVDLYHFAITKDGLFALSAEVFAGRIGSRLDAGASLFRVDPSNGKLLLITANEDTRNGISTSNGTVPLYTDPVIFSGLTRGDYFVAVSARNNTPDPMLGLSPGSDGVFDPNVSHRGTNGTSVGRYVLSVSLTSAASPPKVNSTSISDGESLAAPPSTIQVSFSAAVNLQSLAFESFNQPSPGDMPSVFILGSDGSKFYPRLISYDAAAASAEFLMLDRLPSGNFELHLSGPLGLKDFADQPLIGNDPSGDFVVHFNVDAQLLFAGQNPLHRDGVEPNNFDNPQNLGVLFPHELEKGIEIVRTTSTTHDTEDVFEFELLQSKTLAFNLDRTGLKMSLYDEFDNLLRSTTRESGDALLLDLPAGRYRLGISGWTADDASSISYLLTTVLGTSSDNPPPLTIGPRPASVANIVTLPNTLLGGTSTEWAESISGNIDRGNPESPIPPGSTIPTEANKVNGTASGKKPDDNATKPAQLFLPNPIEISPIQTVSPRRFAGESINLESGSIILRIIDKSDGSSPLPIVFSEDESIFDTKHSVDAAITSPWLARTLFRQHFPPVTLLQQLRAEPIEVSKPDQGHDELVASIAYAFKSTEAAVETQIESQPLNQQASEIATSNSFVKNLSSMVAIAMACGIGISRHFVRRHNRSKSRKSLIRTQDPIEIER